MMTPLQKSPTILPYLFAFLLSLSSTVTAAPPSEITINTRIVAATVYSDRAMITRSGKVALAPGMRSIVIRGLPSLVQDQSVRVTASGIVGSKIIEVQVNRMYLDTLITARTRPLLQKSRNLSFEIRKINDRLSVLKHRNDFLEKIAIASQESIGRELKTSRPAVDEYGKLLDFFDVELSSLKTETRSLEDQRLEHQQTFERIQKELQLIGGSPEKSEKEVTVILNAGIAGTVTIDVSYLVSQASWKPAYDIRASSSDTVVNLTYSAFVQQNTGEDWSDAVVTLTTSRPASGGNPPELDPWFIGAADRAISTVEGVVRDGSTGEPLPGASVTLIGYSTIASTDANGFYRITNIRPGALNLRATAIGFTPVRSTVVTRPFSLAKLDFALPESSVETNEVVVTGDRPRVDKSMTYAVSASEKAISSVVIEPIAVAPQTATVSATVTAASFEIPGKTTIPSDNLEHRVTIMTADLGATFSHTAVPKVQEDVYFRARMKNSTEYPILAGPSSVYLDNSFVNTSALSAVLPAESLDAYLGVDNGVRVERKLLNRVTEVSGLFSKTRNIRYDILIIAQNRKKISQTLSIQENIPVSQDARIKVNVTLPRPEEIAPDVNGMITWQVPLAPGERREIELQYSIESPADMNVGGLD